MIRVIVTIEKDDDYDSQLVMESQDGKVTDLSFDSKEGELQLQDKSGVLYSYIDQFMENIKTLKLAVKTQGTKPEKEGNN